VPQTLHIELASDKHAHALAKLHAGAFYRGWSVDEFACFINDPARTPVFVSLDKNQKIVGFAVIRKVVDEAELLSIVVEEKNRSKGIASSLMKAIFADLFISSAQKIFLEVEEKNHSAVKLYNKFGFKIIGNRQAYYEKSQGEKANALVMVLTLD